MPSENPPAAQARATFMGAAKQTVETKQLESLSGTVKNLMNSGAVSTHADGDGDYRGLHMCYVVVGLSYWDLALRSQHYHSVQASPGSLSPIGSLLCSEAIWIRRRLSRLK